MIGNPALVAELGLSFGVSSIGCFRAQSDGGQAVKTFYIVIAAWTAVVCHGLNGSIPAEEYDPLRVEEAFKPSVEDLAIQDDSRRREIPIRIYLPETKEAAPVILFSHGLGGSRRGCS